MTKAINRQFRLAARPVGDIKESDFEYREEPIPSPKDGEVLVRTIYLSLDPTNRIWMSDVEQYMPPVEIGEVMRGGIIGVVEESKNPSFKQGDLVSGMLGWQPQRDRSWKQWLFYHAIAQSSALSAQCIYRTTRSYWLHSLFWAIGYRTAKS